MACRSALSLILAFAWLAALPAGAASVGDFPCTGTANFATDSGATATLRLEIAGTPSEQARGLMFRRTLDKGSGMLFVFPSLAPRSFWMKNTLISLDIGFFDSTGTLVTLHRETEPLSLKPLNSHPASLVLETTAGHFDTEKMRLMDFSVDDLTLCNQTIADHPLYSASAK